MTALTVAPRFSISEDRLQGCTPWLMRALTLFSYGRCLSVNRKLGHLIVSTQRMWMDRSIRVINFDRIDHIVYRAQSLPSLAPWRYLGDEPNAGWSFFIVSLTLTDESDEVPLFTLWQAAPRRADFIDKLAGASDIENDVGDECARELVDALMRLTGAGIKSRARTPLRAPKNI